MLRVLFYFNWNHLFMGIIDRIIFTAVHTFYHQGE